MRRRVDLDLTLAPVPVPARLVQELCQHALEAEPEECCGLVVGSALERHLRSVRCRNIMTSLHEDDPRENPRDARSAFYMDPRDYERAAKEAEEAGLRITAVYHSHVGAGPYLSAMDLEYAEHPAFPFPDADQIVVSVFDRVVRDVGLFRRTPRGFVGQLVAPVTP